MTYYATEIRYAEKFYIPSVEEAKESYEIAIEVKNFVLRKLNIQEEELKE